MINKSQEIMLSVVIPTYNHEKYIKKAIDSVLAQKTEYSFEVLVGEDKSLDNTKLVLQDYERLNPGKIKVFYRDHNLSNDKLENAPDLRRRAKGKFIITLEGDDFWISDNKIQKQIDFLENNPDYIAVAHNCIVVDEKNNILNESYPCCKDDEYSLRHFLKGIYPGQFATIMCRNYYKENLFDYSILETNLCPGDKLLYFALVTNGKVKCIQENMSAYRHVKKSGTSYSATYKYDFIADENWYLNLLSFANNQDRGVHVAETLYLGCLIHGLKAKQIDFKDFYTYSRNIRYKCYALFLYVYRMISIHIVKNGNAN